MLFFYFLRTSAFSLCWYSSSVYPSVLHSVPDTPILCQNGATYRRDLSPSS